MQKKCVNDFGAFWWPEAIRYEPFHVKFVSTGHRKVLRPPRHVFSAQDAAEYVRAEPRPERFTKALCYSSFGYLSPADADEVLRLLHGKFVNVKPVFIGNIPDFDRKDCFYTKITPNPEELRDNQSQIGIWRSREDFTKLAHDTGWDIQFSSMPAGFYQIHYR
jgi:hypothetical protein